MSATSEPAGTNDPPLDAGLQGRLLRFLDEDYYELCLGPDESPIKGLKSETCPARASMERERQARGSIIARNPLLVVAVANFDRFISGCMKAFDLAARKVHS